VLAELSATAPTDSAADLPELLSLASGFLAETTGRAEIWIASDLQQSNWKPEDPRWQTARAGLANLPQPPQIRVLALGGETAANAAIRILSSRRQPDRLDLEIEITREGPNRDTLTLPVTTTLNGAQSTQTLSLNGQQTRFTQSLPLAESTEAGHGWIELPGDANLRDNQAYFAYGPARPARSLIVAPTGEAADYLALAAAPPGLPALQADVIDPGNWSRTPLVDTAAIFWAAPLPDAETATDLQDFVEEGGQLVFFAPTGESTENFLDIAWSATELAASEQFFILDSWDHNDGLLRDGIDGTQVPGDRLRAIKRRRPNGEFSILARWDDTEPFLARRILDQGTAWFVGSIPDYGWSNLGDADVLLPLVQRAVTAGAERFETGYRAVVGSTAAQAAPGEEVTRLDRSDTPEATAPEHLAGVFRIGERIKAVNRSAAEDLSGKLESELIAPLFDDLRFSLFEEAGRSENDTIARSAWRAFLIAMLFFLIAEALLCLPKKRGQATAQGRQKVRPA
jgi:hypothetical protein